MYKELLLNGHKEFTHVTCHDNTMAEYLAAEIFEFVTYDAAIDELFVRKAIEVMLAIDKRSTFEYQASDENYRWYLIMCNMPFFKDKLEWGTSIRGAWWDKNLTICSLEKTFTKEEWSKFICSMAELVAPDLLA